MLCATAFSLKDLEPLGPCLINGVYSASLPGLGPLVQLQCLGEQGRSSRLK